MEWRISWTYPKVAKIRGPVWDKLRGTASEVQQAE
jgi:hypothetical protein